MRNSLLLDRRNGKRKISSSLASSDSPPSKGILPQHAKLSSRRRKNTEDLTFNAPRSRGRRRHPPLLFSSPCIRCSGCLSFVDDPQNVECTHCLCAWHGACRPKGIYVDHNWLCPKCAKEVTAINLTKSSKIEQKTEGQNLEAAESGASRRRGRPRGSRIHRDSTSSIYCNQTTSKHVKIPFTSIELDDESAAIISARNDLYNQLLEQSDSQKGDQMYSPRHRENTRSPIKRTRQNRQLALQEDTDMFLAAKGAFEEEKSDCNKSEAPSGSNFQWVYMGTGNKMKAVYNSPYPDDVRDAPSIYICTYCLKPTSDVDSYRIHQASLSQILFYYLENKISIYIYKISKVFQTYCPLHHPPGCEIYRDEKISFFEVDGADQKSYCRHLCLLAKLFISSKTLHHEVDTFLFYILTENSNEGCRIVGYFSKEKNPSKNNNLSCLLTLPNSQRSGYGRLLIDMSETFANQFELIDYLGLLYVSSSRSVRNVPHTSIKEMSLRTRIHPIDIVNQLMRDRLLVYKDGNYFVKTEKKAYKWPLALCRRRVVDESHIQWKPDFDVNALDPNKLNYYV
uniref:Histone acetyltransferase n=1 Tax=Heterorhabditis bacteriophora TaxID=37862 RepID=A0A1I7XU25_HETBA